MNIGASIREREDGFNYAIQPVASFPGSSIAAAKDTDGIWTVTDRAGKHRKAVGFDVKQTSTGGNLLVHLVEDFTSAGAVVYHTIVIPSLAAGTSPLRLGYIFDKIDVDNSTISLADVTVLE